MIGYREFERSVFDWLWAKHLADPEFRFSVRYKRAKGSENDYFIGTEKSRYFATTFWYIEVSYPGASIDPISLIFMLGRKGELDIELKPFDIYDRNIRSN